MSRKLSQHSFLGEKLLNTTPFRSSLIQFRDIDMGSRWEPIYADTVAELAGIGNGFEPLESDITADYATSSHSVHDDAVFQQDSSDVNIDQWAELQFTPPVCPPRDPRPPPTCFSGAPRVIAPRRSLGGSEYSAGGESLRRLQSHSSVPSRLHSRHVSNVSATTFSSHGTRDRMEKTLGESNPWYEDDEDEDEDEAVWLRFDEQDTIKSRTDDECHAAAEQNEVSDDDDWDEAFYFSESPKCLSIHNADSIRDNNHADMPTTPPEAKVITKSYVRFNDAFTRQIKEYSNLLDELADPDGTAEALRLVSNKLSTHISNSYTSGTTFGWMSSPDAASAEKDEKKGFHGLSTFVDDEDSDSWDGNARGFVPATPMSNPFADMAKFIDEDEDDDSNFCEETKAPMRPRLGRFPAYVTL